MKIDPTVKKETGYIALWCLILSVLMQAVFLVIGRFNVTVLLGNALGVLTAVLNFFLMGLTVQKAVIKSADQAKTAMKVSQTYRNILILVVVVVAITLECFNTWATVIPLVFPRIAIALRSFKKE